MKLSYEDTLKYCSFILVKHDCETIRQLACINDSICAMSLYPFFTLFCKSYEEFTNKSILDESIAQRVNDIRNTIKYYIERYSKNKKRLLMIDERYDKAFNQLLRFKIIQKYNIHKNLGIYFDESHNIVGNTFLFADNLMIKDMNASKTGAEVYSLALKTGNAIAVIVNDLDSIELYSNIKVNQHRFSYLFYDSNTNKENLFFKEYSKDVNLFMLNILSNIGFLKYILERILSSDNLWLFRIKYIITYYSYTGLNTLANYLNNNAKNEIEKNLKNQIQKCILNDELFFNSNFRNCMMHYSLIHKELCIDEDQFDIKKPYFGLIESCFDGMNYEECITQMNKRLNNMEKFLKEQFNIELVKLKKL